MQKRSIKSKLTKRQREVFDFIIEFFKENSFYPSYGEVSEKFSITKKGACDHILAIEKKGHLERIPYKSRAFIIPEISKELRKFNLSVIAKEYNLDKAVLKLIKELII